MRCLSRELRRECRSYTLVYFPLALLYSLPPSNDPHTHTHTLAIPCKQPSYTRFSPSSRSSLSPVPSHTPPPRVHHNTRTMSSQQANNEAAAEAMRRADNVEAPEYPTEAQSSAQQQQQQHQQQVNEDAAEAMRKADNAYDEKGDEL